VWRNRVYRLMPYSKSAGAALDRAIAGYDAALDRDPTFLWALNESCEMLAFRGQRESWRGLDPGASLDLALARVRRARELDPKFSGPSYCTLFAHTIRAEHLVSAGRSPRAVLEEALFASDSMEDEVAEEPWITAFRAELHRRVAEHALAAGIRPRRSRWPRRR
jgi:eukaryotic-like serine/threonine-protein kinase